MLYQIEEWENVTERVSAMGISVRLKKITVDDFYIPGTKMVEVPDFCNLSDEELLLYLEELRPLSGEICVITDICYREGFGPFLLEADRLEGLVKNHRAIFSDDFFSTDAVIISFQERMVWMFHHSGLVGLFDYGRDGIGE